MQKNEDLIAMLTAVGALSESLGLFKKQLLSNGFSEQEALVLCKELMRNMLIKEGE